MEHIVHANNEKIDSSEIVFKGFLTVKLILKGQLRFVNIFN